MEWKLFEGDAPEYTTPEWYAERESAPHLEQGAHRGRLELAAEYVRQAKHNYGVNTVVDLGCGDGGLLQLIQPDVHAWGYDLQQSNVDASKARGVDVRYGNVLTDDVEWGDLVVMTEMLEHLVDPHGFLRFIADRTSYVIASSPYTETAESHYGFHTWAWDTDGYRGMIEDAGFRVKATGFWSMFQVHLAVKG